MSGWPTPVPAQRTCPAGGLVSVQRRWDQSGWFVICSKSGTLASGLEYEDARALADRHLRGEDGGLQP